jgi:uncharacterized protein (TIGR03437 family)
LAQSLFVKPVRIFGDPHFVGSAASPLVFSSTGPNVIEGRELQFPQGVAIDTSASPPIIYIADTGNNRVLGFQYNTQLTAGAVADLILGQPDRYTNLAGGPGTALSTGLKIPTGLAVDSTGNLYVADTGNNRVLRYPKPFSQPAGYQFPDFILGQTSFSSTGNSGGVSPNTLSLYNGSFLGRTGLAFDSSGNLWVSDTGANRVLRYPAAVLKSGPNDPAADVAVGQVDLLSSTAQSARTSKTGLAKPTSVAFDSAGRMLISDSLARVLVYPANAGTNAAALRILGVATQQPGQPAPAAVSEVSVGNVQSAIAAGSKVLVADSGNNRLLVFDSVDAWPAEATQFSPSATAVIGQSTFAGSKPNQGGGDASAGTLSGPVDIAFAGTELFVADSGNNRVLVYSIGPTGVSPTATRVIGQLDFPYRAPNLVEGKEFGFAGPLNGVSGSIVLDPGSSPPHVYVADTLNNRILGFSDFSKMQNGQPADIVIGQPDFFRTMVNYPAGDSTQPNAQGLNGPTSLIVDSAGNLYVADTLNSRILRFPAPFASGKTALESADLVLGQSGLNSLVTDATDRTMSAPVSLAFTKDGANVSVPASGWLVAADANHNRVLFFQKPFTSGMSATKILGQLNFSSTTAGADPQRMSSPRGVAVDAQDRVIVADTGNGRVQIFGTAVADLPNYATPVLLTNGLSQPYAITVDSRGQFWVADPAQNRLAHFAAIDQLPVNNYAPDATQPAVSPRSAFIDQYQNLLVADGINRVLYFAPQLAVVNAASYIPGRPLAPGAIAAIFPSVAANILSTGTASFTTLPLPVTLADTQALVNGAATPLFFVSPGQINLPLSLSLPSGGSVDVQVIRQSTGQVYGGAEIPLAPASPGLFVIGAGQTGQVAALNQDNTINSATNPALHGQAVQLFGTGQGPVPNAPPDGQASPDVRPTPVNPQILLGGTFVPDANIQYSGLAPSEIGVWQINFVIPDSAPSGNSVSISVLMNSIPSNNPAAPNQVVTSIAVK